MYFSSEELRVSSYVEGKSSNTRLSPDLFPFAVSFVPSEMHCLCQQCRELSSCADFKTGGDITDGNICCSIVQHSCQKKKEVPQRFKPILCVKCHNLIYLLPILTSHIKSILTVSVYDNYAC